MEELNNIIHSLTVGEVQLIRDFYRTKNFGSTRKRRILFDLIANKEVRDERQACLLLYHKESDNTFIQLKKRLKDDVLNFLLIQPFHKVYKSSRIKAEVRCQTLIMQGRLLLSRGVHQEGIALLKKAWQLADKFELYEIRLMILDVSGSSAKEVVGATDMERLYDSTERSLLTLSNIYMAKKSSDRSARNAFYNKENGIDTIDAKGKILEKLRLSCEDSLSKKLRYWYYKTSLDYYKETKTYTQALGAAQDFINFIKSEPVLYKAIEEAEIMMEASRLLILLGRYGEALELAGKAMDLCPGMERICCECLELQFRSGFYLENYPQAMSVLNKALESKFVKEDATQTDKWCYFKDCLQFMLGDLSHFMAGLPAYKNMLKHNSYSLGVRLFEMQILAETGNLALLEYRIESFRKRLSTYGEEALSRVRNIYKVVDCLVKSGLNYKETYFKNKDIFQSLASDKGMSVWQPMGFELIKFEVWFMSKCC